jgi:hypothetical protein
MIDLKAGTPMRIQINATQSIPAHQPELPDHQLSGALKPQASSTEAVDIRRSPKWTGKVSTALQRLIVLTGSAELSIDVMSSCRAVSARVKFSKSCDEEIKYARATGNNYAKINTLRWAGTWAHT